MSSSGPSAPPSKYFTETVKDGIRHELKVLWAAHHAVGLKGRMCLYTMNVQLPWRAKEAGLTFWFGPDDTESLFPIIAEHYNEGSLPNSPLLLNPLVHDENNKPIGSGVIWTTGFALGIEKMEPNQRERLQGLGFFTGPVTRGDVPNVGMKAVAFSKKALPPLADGVTVEGCREIFEIAKFINDDYYKFYMLSGLSYLAKHGGFIQNDFREIVPEDVDVEKIVRSQSVDVTLLKEALFCWNSYDRHNSLFAKFGVDPKNVEHNLKFYNMCARDVELFDACGAKYADAATDVTFEFLVKGWIPKGAITVIGASGGSGKSSIAHSLAVKAAIDYRPDEPVPTWLGSELNLEYCKGLCVFFSGEDGPPIVYSRAKVFDPEGRAQRVMLQRTDFGDGGTLGTFLKRLAKLPDVPLVVIDPARKYLTGDENDATVVSEFFEHLEEFAIRKNSAVVVVHHLAKGSKPKAVLDIYDMLRGSQVFIDRARVVVGMFREGPHVVAGLAKNNIPPQLGMVQGERIFARDAKRLELVQLPGAAGKRGDELTPEQLEALKNE